jgi:hypothetical protein
MTEADIEIILERAKERYPGVKPRIISDNGPQFIAKDFKEFIRISGMDARPNFTLLPSIERQNRAFAQITQGGVHSPRDTAVARRCAASGRGLRRALQQRSFEQRHRVHHTEGHARRDTSRRFRPSGIGSWRRRGDSGRIAASRPCD